MRLQQCKPILFALQDSLLPQLTDFCRKAAAVHFQVIGQFLPVIWNGEGIGSVVLSLQVEIGQQFLPGSPLRGDFNLLIEHEIFGRYHLQQIKNQLIMELAGIAAGGVHYLKKPFDIRELDAYIKRFANRRTTDKNIIIGKYILLFETNRLLYNDRFVKQMAPLEKNAMILFWKNKNVPVSLDLLSKTLWGRDYSPDLDASIHNLISKLRKLLEKDEQVWIANIRGEGYQLTLL